MRSERFNNSEQQSSRIAVCSWTLRPQGPDDLLRRLESLRLSAVQLGMNQVINDEAGWGDATVHLRDAGVWIVSGMMTLAGGQSRVRGMVDDQSGILSDEQWFTNRFLAEQIARLTERGCVGLVCTQIGAIPSDPAGPQWAKLADRLGALAEIFANYGVNLAIETGEAPVEVLDTLLDRLNLPNLGVNFDPAGIVLGGLGEPVEALRRLAKRVRQVHVRDAVPAKSRSANGREVPVGNGVVDWDGVFEAATAISPPIHFVIERDPRAATDQDIKSARELIAYHLAPKSGVRT